MLRILAILFFPSVVPHYFYNPSTHHIVQASSLNNVPSGYKLLPPPKSNTNFKKGNRYGSCIDPGFTCTTPYNISLTFQYECDHDYQCPVTYKCCQHKCFVHKICSKATISGISSNENSNGNSYYDPGSCEKWPYKCQIPYDYSLTSAFKCNNDRQCPRNFKCCQQNCFLHKICSRVTAPTAMGEAAAVKTNTNSVNLKSKEPATDRAVNVEVITEKEDEYGDETEREEKEYEDIEEPVAKLLTVTITEPTTERITELRTTVEKSNLETEEQESLSLSENPHKINLPLTVTRTNQNKLASTRPKETLDSNAIIPEYEAYYYDYGNGTDYDDDDDYDEED